MSQYAPACRPKAGIDSLPGGLEYYQHRVRQYTTTSRSADEIHKIGLSEVARIRAEMMEVIEQAGFEGDFEQWLIYLRDNKEFYPKTRRRADAGHRCNHQEDDGELPKLFGKLPRLPTA